MAKELKEGSYIHIASFMVTDLQLKGNELLIYAIIYGFNQDDESDFHGSLEYLQTWTNSSKQGVLNALKSLMDAGLINKTSCVVNGKKCCRYTVNDVKKVDQKGQESLPDMSTKLTDIGQQSLPNNKYNNTNDIINNTSDVPTKKDYDECRAIIKSNKEYLTSKGKVIETTEYSVKALNKFIKTLFSQEGIEKTKLGLVNSVNNSWLVDTAKYSMTGLFSPKMFAKYIANERSVNINAKARACDAGGGMLSADYDSVF